MDKEKQAGTHVHKTRSFSPFSNPLSFSPLLSRFFFHYFHPLLYFKRKKCTGCLPGHLQRQTKHKTQRQNGRHITTQGKHNNNNNINNNKKNLAKKGSDFQGLNDNNDWVFVAELRKGDRRRQMCRRRSGKGQRAGSE